MKNSAFFVSDLHGSLKRYEKLFKLIEDERPSLVFLAGDLMPSGLFAFSSSSSVALDFFEDILLSGFIKLKKKLGSDYPKVYLILGNDDGKSDEESFIEADKNGIWNYIHGKKVEYDGYSIYGYSYIPPTPFMLKDWERYDVSRYVDPGCTPPEEGSYSTRIDRKKIQFQTIKKDLDELGSDNDLSKSIFLFHSPPYQTKLDRAALDGKSFDYVPLDVHIGSIAIKRFIEDRQPLLTMHGHVHESTSLTKNWQDKIGTTISMNAAHNGKELSLIRFSLDDIKNASRELV